MVETPLNSDQNQTDQSKSSVGYVVSSVVAGLLIGLIAIAYTLSSTVVAYGAVPELTSRGIGLALAGTVVFMLIVTFTTSFRGIIGHPQSIPAAILGLITIGIMSAFPAEASPEELFITVLAAVIITSLLTGLFYLGLGFFDLGDLVRFLPYPVIGGFLAGTGWLLVLGGLGVMTGLPLDLFSITLLIQSSAVTAWLPGVILALVLLVVLKRYDHFLIFPSLICGAIIAFYLFLWFSGVSFAEAMAQGWLMGPFPEGRMWEPVNPLRLANAHWTLVFQQGANIIAAAVISVVALLLNATSLELIYNDNLDLNKELRVAGWGNVANAVLGGLPSFHSFSLSTLNYRVAGQGRLAGLVAAAVILISVVYGAQIIALMPRFVIGSIVCYLGLSLLYEWVFEAWFKFSRIDYLIVVTILVVIAAIGFLQGVVLGTVLALILFVVAYSRVEVVKHALSGATYQSRVTRGQAQRSVLDEQGEALKILELQGFIFFGTANHLLDQVVARLEAPGKLKLRFLVLDFRRVIGIDSTALLSFAKIKQLAEKQDVVLVLSGMAAELRYKFEQSDIKEDKTIVHYVADLDHGLEWCENEILALAGELGGEHDQLLMQLAAILPEANNLENLIEYFERLEVDQGQYLIRQGDRPEDLFFVERGQITAQLEYPDREPNRLETMRGGRVVGEIGFYLSTDRLAAVVADIPSVVYRFSLDTLSEVEQHDPVVAATFHKLIAHLLMYRVAHLIRTVDALQR